MKHVVQVRGEQRKFRDWADTRKRSTVHYSPDQATEVTLDRLWNMELDPRFDCENKIYRENSISLVAVGSDVIRNERNGVSQIVT